MKRLQYPVGPLTGALVMFFVFGQVPFAPPLPPTPPGLDDRDITRAVQQRLALEGAVREQRIVVTTQDGIVTLSGTVPRLSAKLAAGAAARMVRGVIGVFNEIEVEPRPRLDSSIRVDVVTAITADPLADIRQIDVEVENGVVILTGTVGSPLERSTAEEIAQGVAGVAGVRNLLTFEPVAERPDGDIAEDIQYRLRADADVAAGLITVVVQQGEVTLAGSVRSAAERMRAEEQVWTVPGVRAVENNLDVQWWRADEMAAWPDPWTDGLIRETIEEALQRNPRVDAGQVATTVRDGVVILMGEVVHLQAKRAAEEEARNIVGVRRVQNQLRVRPPEERPDDTIAEDIQEGLQRDAYVERYDVQVQVENGLAQLRGDVDSLYAREQAEAIAARVAGVIDIRNQLEVVADETARADRDIEEDIKNYLRWDPVVDPEKIDVEVQACVATLTGTVDNWTQVRAAERSARWGGATRVVNRLAVARSPEPAN